MLVLKAKSFSSCIEVWALTGLTPSGTSVLKGLEQFCRTEALSKRDPSASPASRFDATSGFWGVDDRAE